jgi:hypothetical protein
VTEVAGIEGCDRKLESGDSPMRSSNMSYPNEGRIGPENRPWQRRYRLVDWAHNSMTLADLLGVIAFMRAVGGFWSFAELIFQTHRTNTLRVVKGSRLWSSKAAGSGWPARFRNTCGLSVRQSKQRAAVD